MPSTSPATDATAEPQAAAEYLGSLDDPLAPWVQTTGPIDAYEMQLPVAVHDPLEWLSFAIVGLQISMAAAAAIFIRLTAALGAAAHR